jgi:sugar lactone lactonase YvrE
MSAASNNLVGKMIARAIAALMVLAMVLTMASVALGSDKKKKPAPNDEGDSTPAKYKNILEGLDLSRFVWPNPPAVTRIRYLNYWSGEKLEVQPQQKKKTSWMERVSGVATGGAQSEFKPRWQLVVPNGIAIDSKGKVYIADSKVRAIFVVDVETGKYEMIKNGSDGRFQWLTGLAMDDSDRLFAADSGMHRVTVFGPDHKIEGAISQGLAAPAGLAVDNENRLLYVADPELDQVVVFDADPPHKKIRTIGTTGQGHKLTTPGDFAKPIGVAVDQDTNLYVTDTWNNRVEVFDADGNFIRTFGKAGDGVGYFSRPKGIAIDSDGHVWVADGMQERVQVFTPEGRVLIWMGSDGLLPGMFRALENVAIDSKNRVFTTEQFPGRLQVFRYTPDAEAKAEKERRDQELKKKAEQRALPKKAGGEKPPDSPQ